MFMESLFLSKKKATDAISKLLSGGINYVQIAIDCDNEKVILDHTENVQASQLGQKIPVDQPRFHFYSWAHVFEGSKTNSIVFIYSSPDGSNGTKSAPVKMRMLYSSSKANVGEIVKSVGGNVDGRLEINTAEDISEDILMNLIHPQKEEKKANFSKPSRPGKGGRTLTKK